MLSHIKSLVVRTYNEWSRHDAPTLGAALSYYTVLSLAPLLVVAVAITGLVFRRESVQNQILEQVTALVGASGADAFRQMLSHANSPKTGIITMVVGIVGLLAGASGVFSQLRKALNHICDIEPKQSSGILSAIKEQLFSFAMVVGVGFLLLVSLIGSTMLAAITRVFNNHVPSVTIEAINTIVSVVGITLLFMLVYRFVPEQTLAWRRLWPGSLSRRLVDRQIPE